MIHYISTLLIKYCTWYSPVVRSSTILIKQQGGPWPASPMTFVTCVDGRPPSPPAMKTSTPDRLLFRSFYRYITNDRNIWSIQIGRRKETLIESRYSHLRRRWGTTIYMLQKGIIIFFQNRNLCHRLCSFLNVSIQSVLIPPQSYL